MSNMMAVQVPQAGADFEVVERAVPEPEAGQVRVKVEACGVCHSDMFTKEGAFPGIEYPRVPGHEVVGRIDKLGEGVHGWSAGERVGVGWHGAHCGYCRSCRRGDFTTCENQLVSGLSFDGGYAQYMVVDRTGLVRLPQEVDAAEAAPLLCAGVTTYNALRHSGAQPGDLVAVQGVGGLGHLGVQYARRMGMRTVAISSGPDKRDLAVELGAHYYIDARQEVPAEALQKLGGAQAILATAPNADAISQLIDGLGPNGRMMIIGATADPVQVVPTQIIGGRKSIQGFACGHATDSEDTINFSVLTDVRARVETFPLRDAARAYERMMTNQARFRAVLVMD